MTTPVSPGFLCRLLVGASLLVAAGSTAWAQAPTITTQPITQAVAPGGAGTLSVAATGSGTLGYQWARNGVAIAGATNASYTISNVQLANAGRYSVTVTSAGGAITSAPAQVNLTGILWAMGGNAAGQLGDGTTNRRTSPVQVTTGVSAVAAGAYHSLYLKTDGTLWATGQDIYGQLGDGTTSQRVSPVPVATGVSAVAAGTSHSLYVKTDGTLWAMGLNNYGQLGDGTTTQRTTPVQVAAGVSAMAAGMYHSLYLKTDGTLWAMGANYSGQLGDGTTISRTLPVPVAVGVSAVAAGGERSMFVKIDGTLWAMGWNSSGQLGDGTTISRSSPVQVAGGVSMVAAGSSHTLFLKTDGTLWATGQNSSGQLGDGTTTSRSSPVQVAVGVNAVTAGTSHSLYLKTDGTLWAMGSNYSGQLGDGTTTQRIVHVQGPANVLALAAGDTSSFFLQAAGAGTGPTVAEQPAGGSYLTGTLAVLSVVASGPGPFDYRWRKDGVELAGWRESMFFIPAVQAADAGGYSVVISNSAGSIVSATAVLTVVTPTPPSIVTQPESQTVPLASVVGFTVTAVGTPPLYYQWRKNGVPFPGAVTASHVMNNLQVSDAGSYDVIVSNSLGSVTSSAAVLALTPPVWFTSQPSSSTVYAGTTVTLTASAVGYNATPAYQWLKNGTAIAGATNSTLNLGAVPLASAGTYSVVATTSAGSVTSNPANVNILDVAPLITQQPVGATLAVGGATTLSVTVAGTAPLTFQWRRNGLALAGATAAALPIANAQTYQTGDYDVVVSNPAGTTNSAVSHLNVVPRVVAYSARLVIGPEGALGVFTVEGAASKTLLLRAVGPGLAPFGLTGLLGDPQLEVFNSAGNLIAVNDNWNSATNADAVAATTAAVGAFALGVGSRDSAVLGSFAPGTYTVRASAAHGAGGVGYLELYDADLATGPISTLPYVAVRGRVASGGGVVIGGLGSNGRGQRSYLLRAVGPGLGLPTAVSDPSFLVVRENALVGMNDNWDAVAAEADATAAAGTRLGLVPLTAGSKDAALVLTGNLHAGSHTVQVSSPEGPGGLVLVEFHDLDTARPATFAPVIASPPVAQVVAAGSPFTLRVLAGGTGPLAYQWVKDGVPLSGATAAVYSVATAASAHAGGYAVVVTNGLGAATSLPALVTLQSGPAGSAATQAMAGNGYVAGGTVVISNTLTFAGTPSSLGWSVALPTGWSFASDAGASGDVKPVAGATGTVEWAWSTMPASPVTFSYTVNVPAGESAARTLVAAGIVREGGNVQVIAATPSPLTVNPVGRYHSADTNVDGKISLFELTRVIELYNARNGTTRTGCYVVQPGTEDGFAPDPTRTSSAVVSFLAYHTGDSNRDGKLSLLELTRVIELYNTRSGTTRSGQYHAQTGTEDGFAPGP